MVEFDARAAGSRVVHKGLMVDWLARTTAACLALASLVLADGCSGGATDPPDRSHSADPRPADALFLDVTDEVGLTVPRQPWPDGTYFIAEIQGPGAGVFDYDNDGDLDIVEIRFPPPGRLDDPAPNRLYRQDPGGRFVDVTEASGLGDPGAGQGLAIGDADNDGDLDVYVANYGRDTFYRNDGDGTFTEATSEAGFREDLWSSSAAFCDYDRDGDLDLYVTRYLRAEHRGHCFTVDGHPDYCGPTYFDGVPDLLYRNDGDGLFTDVTAAAGIVLPDGGKTAKGLGVVCLDLNGDRWPDFFVANDSEPNHLWINRRDGTFSEEAMPRGAAVSLDGMPEAGMGIGVGDADGDGTFDLYVTHLAKEHNRLYLQRSSGMFVDMTLESRLHLHDLEYTGFGCGFLDYDHDGDLDLAVVNGRVNRGRVVPGARAGDFWNRFAEPNLLFENLGPGVFENVSARAPDFSGRIELGRGLALGDLDNDGDVDMVLSAVGDGLHVFRNVAPRPGTHWLMVRATSASRDAIGAVVEVSAGGRRLVRPVLPASSYQSSNDFRVHFGLGAADRVDQVEVLWPDGRKERFPAPEVDRQVTLVQGTGQAL